MRCIFNGDRVRHGRQVFGGDVNVQGLSTETKGVMHIYQSFRHESGRGEDPLQYHSILTTGGC